MATGGENIITPSGGSRSARKSASALPTDEFGMSHFLFYAFFLFLILKSCATDDSVRLAAANPAPAPPAPRIAVIESSAPGTDPLKIVLEGGSYEFTYEEFAKAPEGERTHAGDRTFTANFANGTTVGDLNTADTIIIVGNVNLTVKDIYRNDNFRATIHDTWEGVTAKFKYARSPRGPPGKSAAKRVRIIIFGKIVNINLGKSHHYSTRNIEIFDLDPTPEDFKRYDEALQAHERKQREAEWTAAAQREAANAKKRSGAHR